MYTNLQPAHSTDTPKLAGNFPTSCSKSKIISLISNIKNVATRLLITESLAKQGAHLHKASFTPWGRPRREERTSISQSWEAGAAALSDKAEAWLCGSHLLLHSAWIKSHAHLSNPFLKSQCPAAKWNVSTIKAWKKLPMNLCPLRQICLNSIFMVPENQRCVDKLEVI